MSNYLEQPNKPQLDIKRHLLFMAIIFIGTFLWIQYTGSNAKNASATLSATDSAIVGTAAIPALPAINGADSTANLQTNNAQTVAKLPTVFLHNAVTRLTVDPNNGGIADAFLNDFLDADSHKAVDLFKEMSHFNALAPKTNAEDRLTDIRSETAENDSQIVIRRQYLRMINGIAAGQYEVKQTLQLHDGYRTTCQINVTNTGSAPLSLPTLTVSTGGIQPELYLSGDKAYGTVHTVAGMTPQNVLCTIGADKDEADFSKALTGSAFRWVMAQNKYCASILRCDTDIFNSAQTVREKIKDPVTGAEHYAVGVEGTWQLSALNPGSSIERSVTLYTGPKELKRIESFDESIVGALQLSYFSWFEVLARWTLVVLFWIHQYICSDYGLAIILLTLTIKLIFWPVQTRATDSMRKMQELQPKMKAIREEFKDNPQVMNSKVMELYRTEGVNPVSGCLPLLLQMPVFIALFAALNGAVELRQESFLWIADLTRPDTIGHLFGFAINPLILAQTALMVFQQRLSPSNGDPMQQKMMYLMPIVILVFFYNMPAGLTLYMTVSSIPQILQQWYNLKKIKPTGKPNS